MNFSEAGKLAIATVIQRLEKPEEMMPERVSDDWYTALWQALVRDISDAKSLASNQVRFITFNYDRSLEHFLHEATSYTFSHDSENGLGVFEPLEILHMYGQLGKYGGVADPHCVQYESFEPDFRLLKRAAAGIKIIPEFRDDDDATEIARSWFSWAEQICFLGFGFDPLNLQRLGLAEVIEALSRDGRSFPRIFASTHGLKTSEIDAASKRIWAGHSKRWTPIDATCFEALRTTGILV
jgi:hypothetical protein